METANKIGSHSGELKTYDTSSIKSIANEACDSLKKSIINKLPASLSTTKVGVDNKRALKSVSAGAVGAIFAASLIGTAGFTGVIAGAFVVLKALEHAKTAKESVKVGNAPKEMKTSETSSEKVRTESKIQELEEKIEGLKQISKNSGNRGKTTCELQIKKLTTQITQLKTANSLSDKINLKNKILKAMRELPDPTPCQIQTKDQLTADIKKLETELNHLNETILLENEKDQNNEEDVAEDLTFNLKTNGATILSHSNIIDEENQESSIMENINNYIPEGTQELQLFPDDKGYYIEDEDSGEEYLTPHEESLEKQNTSFEMLKTAEMKLSPLDKELFKGEMEQLSKEVEDNKNDKYPVEGMVGSTTTKIEELKEKMELSSELREIGGNINKISFTRIHGNIDDSSKKFDGINKSYNHLNNESKSELYSDVKNVERSCVALIESSDSLKSRINSFKTEKEQLTKELIQPNFRSEAFEGKIKALSRKEESLNKEFLEIREKAHKLDSDTRKLETAIKKAPLAVGGSDEESELKKLRDELNG
ncbi:MAG: hypothetical protein H0T62_05595 [Parachlamydiaceae bacterium]|nr:hypothetical protein [Parachlamydiaceae bacterium]